jgi:hypothetical protein
MLRKCAYLSLFVLLLLSELFAESRARIVRISQAEGDVAIDRGEGEGLVRAFANMPVVEGLRLWTRTDGRAEVEFEDGSTLRLAPDTQIEFQQLHLDDRGDKVSHINVNEGTVYANVKDHNHDQFVLASGPQQIGLKHSSRFRLVADRDQLSVAVFRGELEVERNGGEHVKVKKNETLAMDVADPDRYYLSKGITETAFDSWDREREEQVATLEQQYAGGGTPTNYSGNYYGYSDLAYYGGWSTIPGYGQCWRPWNVGFGWDPFAYGAWVFYPGFGYTWVSSYPWGWTPFRFGSWIHPGGRGWWWRPGPRIVNITNINISNPPAGFVPPRPPVVTNGPAVAVVNGGGQALPANPRTAWMPRPGGGLRPVDEDRRNVIPGKRAFGNDDVEALRGRQTGVPGVSNISPARTATQAGPASAPGARPDDVATRTTIDRGERIHTRDRDYNGVDYRTRPGASMGASSGGSFMGGSAGSTAAPTPSATIPQNPPDADVRERPIGRGGVDAMDRGRAMPMPAPMPSPVQSAPQASPAPAMRPSAPPAAAPAMRPSAPAAAPRSAPSSRSSGGASPRASSFSPGRMSAPAGHGSSGSHGGGHSR